MKVCLGLVCSVLCWATFAGEALGQTVTFFPTGGQQTFTVPAGVSTVRVVTVGGRGGAVGTNGAPGGFGATASADLSVSPGQLLYVEVGGNGGFGSGPSPGAGGFNGGGAGGSGAGGGGGASDVRTSPAGTDTSLGSRQVVAGGGGGGTEGSGGGNAGANGGAAGNGDAAPGQGAIPTGPGVGGQATLTGTSAGSEGTFGIGGAGAPGTDPGAGGGGGVFGGGGGAGCSNAMYCDALSLGGNGGGGSSGFFAPRTSNSSVGTDTSGVGSVTITYTGPAPVQPPLPPSTALIGNSLLSQLVPHGKAARIRAIRKHHGYTFNFTALLAGKVTISWYQTRRVRHPHAHAATKHVLVATGSHRFSAAGTGKLAIPLTGKGRKLFKHAKRLKLTAKGKFTPAGGAAIARQKTFTLRN